MQSIKLRKQIGTTRYGVYIHSLTLNVKNKSGEPSYLSIALPITSTAPTVQEICEAVSNVDPECTPTKFSDLDIWMSSLVSVFTDDTEDMGDQQYREYTVYSYRYNELGEPVFDNPEKAERILKILQETEVCTDPLYFKSTLKLPYGEGAYRGCSGEQ